jgi:hypothetical protein
MRKAQKQQNGRFFFLKALVITCLLARLWLICSLSHRLMYKEAAGMVCVWRVTPNALQDCRVFQKPVLTAYDKVVLRLNVRETLNDSGTIEAYEALTNLCRRNEPDMKPANIRRIALMITAVRPAFLQLCSLPSSDEHRRSHPV